MYFQFLLVKAKHEVLKMVPTDGYGLGQLVMNDVLDNFLYKWRNYLKGDGVTEGSATDNSEKKIQINSFLLKQCDLRRKLEVVFLKAQSTDYIES